MREYAIGIDVGGTNIKVGLFDQNMNAIKYLQTLTDTELEADQKNEYGNQQSADIFDPPMAEGMVGVRLMAGDPKADERNKRGPRVRQIVEGIRRHGNSAGKNSRHQFAGKEQHIEKDPHRAAENAVF